MCDQPHRIHRSPPARMHSPAARHLLDMPLPGRGRYADPVRRPRRTARRTYRSRPVDPAALPASDDLAAQRLPVSSLTPISSGQAARAAMLESPTFDPSFRSDANVGERYPERPPPRRRRSAARSPSACSAVISSTKSASTKSDRPPVLSASRINRAPYCSRDSIGQ